MLQVTTLEILIRISLSQRRSYSFTKLVVNTLNQFMIKSQSQLLSLRFPHHATPADFNILLPHVTHSVTMDSSATTGRAMSDENVESQLMFSIFVKTNFTFYDKNKQTKKHTTGIAVSSPNGVLQPKGSVCRNSSRTRTFLPEPMRWATCWLRGERSL